jgi:PAS domain S-box-containing protein
MPKLSQDEIVPVLQGYQDRLAEAERQGERRFEQVFAAPPPGVCVHEFDMDGVIRRVNGEGLRVLAYEAAQLVGRKVWEVVVMEDVSRVSVQKKLAGEKDIKPFVRTFRRGDGSGVVMLLVDRRLLDAQGQPRGIRTAMMSLEEDRG